MFNSMKELKKECTTINSYLFDSLQLISEWRISNIDGLFECYVSFNGDIYRLLFSEEKGFLFIPKSLSLKDDFDGVIRFSSLNDIVLLEQFNKTDDVLTKKVFNCRINKKGKLDVISGIKSSMVEEDSITSPLDFYDFHNNKNTIFNKMLRIIKDSKSTRYIEYNEEEDFPLNEEQYEVIGDKYASLFDIANSVLDDSLSLTIKSH